MHILTLRIKLEIRKGTEMLFSNPINHCKTTFPHLLIYFGLVNIVLCFMGLFSVNLLWIVPLLTMILSSVLRDYVFSQSS